MLTDLRRRSPPTGLGFWTGATRAAAVPTGVACAGALQLAGPLAALGLTGLGTVLHGLLAVVAPVNVLIIGFGFRRHRKPLAILLAGLGLLLLVVHGATHFAPTPETLSAWLGVGLLIGAAALDWRALKMHQTKQATGPGS